MSSATKFVGTLILKAHLITAKADDNFDFFFYFQKKTSLDISFESSAKQTIHMKYQDLFSLKNKNFRMSLLQILLVTLRVRG